MDRSLIQCLPVCSFIKMLPILMNMLGKYLVIDRIENSIKFSLHFITFIFCWLWKKLLHNIDFFSFLSASRRRAARRRPPGVRQQAGPAQRHERERVDAEARPPDSQEPKGWF